MSDCLYSGGANGADTLFGECAQRYGHDVVHYSFPGHGSKIKDTIKLSLIDLKEADPWLVKSNKYLQRKWPTHSEYIDRLLQRNYWQIKESKSIYAVSSVDQYGHIAGGTAWAIMMGILKGISRVYVFDQAMNCWHELKEFDKEKNIIDWTPIRYMPPFPLDKYTGIGTRKLNKNGTMAICSLYEN